MWGIRWTVGDLGANGIVPQTVHEDLPWWSPPLDAEHPG